MNENLNIYNSRGEVVGLYNYESKTYFTKRYAMRGQIFLRKSMFNGQLKERAIAIDNNILQQLIGKGCGKIVFTIIGIEKMAYSIWITPENIIKKGVKINFDKKNEQGFNVTGFGEQYVISSISDCIKMDVSQLELENFVDSKIDKFGQF